MQTQMARVVAVTEDLAVVRGCPPSACEACKAKGLCAKSDTPGIEMTLPNLVGARVGDTVEIGLASASFLKIMALLYLVPVFCLITGALAGNALAGPMAVSRSGLSAIGGFSAFLLSIPLIRLVDTRLARRAAYHPQIRKILSETRGVSSGFLDVSP